MSLMLFDQSRNDHFVRGNTRFLPAEASFSRKNSKFSYSRAFISPGMTILFVKIRGFCMQRLVFYVKTRGFRTVEPFGGVQWGSVWLLFGVWYAKIRGFCVRRPVFYVKTRGFRTVGPSGAPMGLCLDAVCSLVAPCGALL